MFRIENTSNLPAEIGDTATRIQPLIFIDVFARQRWTKTDLKDFLVSILKAGLPYTEYVVNGNTVTSRTPNGRIRITKIDDKPVLFTKDKSALAVYEQEYRHLLTLTVGFRGKCRLKQ